MCAREEISCRRGRYSLLASELTSDALLGIPAEKVKDDDAFSRKHPAISNILNLCPGAIFGLIAVLSFMIIANTSETSPS